MNLLEFFSNNYLYIIFSIILCGLALALIFISSNLLRLKNYSSLVYSELFYVLPTTANSKDIKKLLKDNADIISDNCLLNISPRDTAVILSNLYGK